MGLLIVIKDREKKLPKFDINKCKTNTTVTIDNKCFEFLGDEAYIFGKQPIKDLVLFLFLYIQESHIIDTSIAKDWILTLTKFLDNTQLVELSREFEKIAFKNL